MHPSRILNDRRRVECHYDGRCRVTCVSAGVPADRLGTIIHHTVARSAVIATIDDLLSKVDSKYTLVHLAAQRAREINDYYHSLGEGLGQYTPPLVEQVDSNKPLSIALEEIAATKIVPQYAGERRAAEDLLSGAGDDGGAEIFTLGDAGIDELGNVDAEIPTGDDAPVEGDQA